MVIKQPDSTGLFSIHFSKEMTFPQIWHDKLAKDKSRILKSDDELFPSFYVMNSKLKYGVKMKKLTKK